MTKSNNKRSRVGTQTRWQPSMRSWRTTARSSKETTTGTMVIRLDAALIDWSLSYEHRKSSKHQR